MYTFVGCLSSPVAETSPALEFRLCSHLCVRPSGHLGQCWRCSDTWRSMQHSPMIKKSLQQIASWLAGYLNTSACFTQQSVLSSSNIYSVYYTCTTFSNSSFLSATLSETFIDDLNKNMTLAKLHVLYRALQNASCKKCQTLSVMHHYKIVGNHGQVGKHCSVSTRAAININPYYGHPYASVAFIFHALRQP